MVINIRAIYLYLYGNIWIKLVIIVAIWYGFKVSTPIIAVWSVSSVRSQSQNIKSVMYVNALCVVVVRTVMCASVAVAIMCLTI